MDLKKVCFSIGHIVKIRILCQRELDKKIQVFLSPLCYPVFMNKPPQLFLQALNAGQKRDYTQAITLLHQLLDQQELYPPALLYLSRSYYALEEYRNALFYGRQFLKLQPEEKAGYYFLGRTYLATKNYKRALRNFKKCLTIDPEHPLSYSMAGLCYLHLKAPSKALEHMQEAVNLAPEDQQIYSAYINCLQVNAIGEYRRGNWDLSRQMFRFLLENEAPPALSLTYLIHIARKEGQWEDLITYYQEILNHTETDPVLTTQYLEALLNTDQGEKAKNLYHGLKEELPDLEWDHFNDPQYKKYLAYAFFKEGDQVNAADTAREVLQSEPQEGAMHFLLGEIAIQQKRWERGLNHISQALKGGIKDKEIFFALIICYWETGNYAKASQELRKLYNESPEDPDLSYYYILSLSLLGETQEPLIPHIEALIRQRGPDQFLLKAYANQLRLWDFQEKSYSWYKRAYKLIPQDKEVIQALYTLSSEYGSDQEKIDFTLEYYHQNPGNRELLKEVIHLLISEKSYKKALHYITTAGEGEEIKRLEAFCYRELKEYPKAILLYRDLLKRAETNFDYLMNLLLCLHRNKQNDLALSIAKGAQGQFRKEKSLVYIIGYLMYQKGDYDQALQLFRQLLDKNGKDWRAMEYMSQIYSAKGDDLQAQRFKQHASKYRK